MKNTLEILATEYAYKTFFKNNDEYMEPKEIYGTLRVGVLKELLYEQITQNLTMLSKALNE